jgi:hypothetical protein
MSEKKKVLVIDLQEVIDHLRKHSPEAEDLGEAFKLSDERCEEIVDPLDYSELLGKPDNVGFVLANIVESAQNSTENSVEAFWLIYQMVAVFTKGSDSTRRKIDKLKSIMDLLDDD